MLDRLTSLEVFAKVAANVAKTHATATGKTGPQGSHHRFQDLRVQKRAAGRLVP